jgi:hypothetical protein
MSNRSAVPELFRAIPEQLSDSDHTTVPPFPPYKGERRNGLLVRFGTVICG